MADLLRVLMALHAQPSSTTLMVCAATGIKPVKLCHRRLQALEEFGLVAATYKQMLNRWDLTEAGEEVATRFLEDVTC